jgi:hypothetical protein
MVKKLRDLPVAQRMSHRDTSYAAQALGKTVRLEHGIPGEMGRQSRQMSGDNLRECSYS